ncbi:MAG: response regulator [Gammaproteobacteria bacterium]
MAHTVTARLPVLVVDDEPPLLHSVSLLLRSAGIASVLTLEDSRAVLPLLAEQEVGVLLLDLSMPHLSGQQILKRVAADYPDVSVIVMTASNDLETAVHYAGRRHRLSREARGEQPSGLVRAAGAGAA